MSFYCTAVSNNVFSCSDCWIRQLMSITSLLKMQITSLVSRVLFVGGGKRACYIFVLSRWEGMWGSLKLSLLRQMCRRRNESILWRSCDAVRTSDQLCVVLCSALLSCACVFYLGVLLALLVSFSVHTYATRGWKSPVFFNIFQRFGATPLASRSGAEIFRVVIALSWGILGGNGIGIRVHSQI